MTRTLRRGLDWRVETQVERLTPPGDAAALQSPLLPDESVTTPEVRVAERQVRVNFAAEQMDYAWDSVLPGRETLQLSAPATAWFHRGLMLAWALWLAFALLNWLRWGWTVFARDGLWRAIKLLELRAPREESAINN